MYISHRAAKLRNGLVSLCNGSITLVILLIAPLGLTAVIINTVLVSLATYGISNLADRAIAGLQRPSIAESPFEAESTELTSPPPSHNFPSTYRHPTQRNQ